MTKEELIASYPQLNSHTIWILIIIGLVVVIVVYFAVNEKIPSTSVYCSLIIGILVILLDLSIASENLSKDVEKWERVILATYIEQIPKDKAPIIYYSLNDDGSLSALIDSDRGANSIGGVSSIKYYESDAMDDKGYIEFRVVSGLSSVGRPDGYMDVVAYLPK